MFIIKTELVGKGGFIIEKVCTGCKQSFPATDEYFYKQKKKNGNYYLQAKCKKCTIKINYKWNRKHAEEHKKVLKKHDAKPEQKERKRKVGETRRKNGKYKKWQQDNPEKIKQYNQNRFHKKHKISKQEWKDCKEYFNNSCAYCSLTYEEHKIKYKTDLHKEHVDHYGVNNLSNCIPACKVCNSSKWEKEFEDWYNENNSNFTIEKYNKILKWINEDYKLFK